MLSFFRGEDITIFRKTEMGEDKYGNPVAIEEEIETSVIVAFQNSSTSFSKEGSEVSTEIKLIFDEGVVILENDTFSFRGTLWEKDGTIEARDPFLIANKFLPAPVVIAVKQIKGNVHE